MSAPGPESGQPALRAVGDLPLAIEMLAAHAARIPLARLLDRVRRNLDAMNREDDPTRPKRRRSTTLVLPVV